MKKYLFIVACLMGLAIVVKAAGPVPESSNGTALPYQYGGFQLSSSVFSVDGGTFTGVSVVPFVNFSSGTVDDWVDFFQTTSTVNGSSFTVVSNSHAMWVARVYNIGSSTGVASASYGRGLSQTGGLTLGERGGWMWKPRNNTNPGITVEYIGGKMWDTGGN